MDDETKKELDSLNKKIENLEIVVYNMAEVFAGTTGNVRDFCGSLNRHAEEMKKFMRDPHHPRNASQDL